MSPPLKSIALSGRTLAAAILVPCLLLCTRDYNPFTDSSRAQASATRMSFVHGDTLEVFCRETLDVAVAVAEMVDSFTLSVTGNRLFSEDTTVAITGSASMSGHAYQFVVSFHDTGTQHITILTHRRNGEQRQEGYDVYVRSPLSQDTVRGTFDDTVSLAAPAVQDIDVVYHWDFGRGNVVESVAPAIRAVIRDAGYDSTGYLWVSDAQEQHASPTAGFYYTFNDTIGPAIVCVNEGSEGRDTVMTGSSTFFFRVRITDRGGAPDSASIDGAAFDQVEGTMYVKTVLSMDTLTGLLPVKVWARDNRADNNVSERTFYLGYDKSLPGIAEGVRIRVLIPSGDSTVSSIRGRYVLGTVENYTGAQALLDVQVNGTSTGAVDTLSGVFSSQWSRSVYLAGASNAVEARATSLAGALLDSAVLTMLYDSTASDTVEPVILRISIDGEPAGGQYVSGDSASIRILAFDEGSGMESLRVNGKVRAASDAAGVWDVAVGLAHGADGNEIRVVATDEAGLSKDTSVVVFQNRAPEVKVALTPPYPIVVGETYRDTLIAEDGDGDRVRYEKAVGPASLDVSGDGAVVWAPALEDTGRYQLIVRYRDGIVSQLYSCSLHVVDSVYYENAVAFAVSEQDFPVFVTAGVDTVRVTLSMVPNTGSPPFTYSAVRRVGASYVDVPIESGNRLVWAPGAADTGYQHFVVRVEDQLLRADTLYPRILVVPPNRPCALSAVWSGDTLAGGLLDMSDSPRPETLTIAVSDPDLEQVERYRLVVTRGGKQDVRTIDQPDTVRIVFDTADAPAGRESLFVSIEDMGGHTAADTFVVSYSSDERLARLVLNTTASGVEITEDLYGFPLLVRLNSVNFDFSQTESEGSDVRFARRNGDALAFEITSWDAAAQQARIWVRVDTLWADDAAQYIAMLWGDAQAPGGSNGAAVFDTADGYEAVFHFNGELLDVTHNHNVGVDSGGVTTDNPGVAGTCAHFTGDNFVAIPSPAGLPVYTPQGSSMVTAWIQYPSPEGYHTLYSEADSGNCIPFSSFVVWENTLLASWSDDLDDVNSQSTASSAASAGHWHFVTHIHNADVDSFFLDGAFAGSRTKADDRGHTTLKVAAVGALYRPACSLTSNMRFIGDMDEVRIQNKSRDPAWLKLCYETQKPGSSFIRFE